MFCPRNENTFCLNNNLTFTDYRQFVNQTMIIDILDNKNNNKNNNYNNQFSNRTIHICCLGIHSCKRSIFSTNTSYGSQTSTNTIAAATDITGITGITGITDLTNVRLSCRAGGSCSYTEISNIDSIIASGESSLSYSTINDITGMVRCEASYACKHMQITNARLVVCTEVNSCFKAIISNVYTVIGLGYQSLAEAQIINATNILLLSYKAGSHLNITILSGYNDSSINNVKIY